MIEMDTMQNLVVVSKFDVLDDYNSLRVRTKKTKVVRALEITNNAEERAEHIVVKLSAVPPFFAPVSKAVEQLAPGAKAAIDVELTEDQTRVFNLQERTEAAITAAIYQGEEEIFCDTKKMMVHPLNEWPERTAGAESLCALVTPNERYIHELKKEVVAQLEQAFHRSSIVGYQGGADYVKKMLSAVYAAVAKQNLTYCTMPSSYEREGQRVRMIPQVLKEQVANCVEVSVLMAAAMEACGLHPIMICVPGHMFPGCWLKSATFSEACVRDGSALTQRVSAGDILVFEGTMALGNPNATLEAGCQSAVETLRTNKVEYVIDVKRARAAGITPLPNIVGQEDGTWKVSEEPAEPELTPELPEEPEEEPLFIPEDLTPQERKLYRWSHALLGGNLRSAYLSLQKDAIPLMLSDASALLAALEHGARLMKAPSEAGSWLRKETLLEQLTPEAGKELLAKELKAHRLRSALSDKQLRTSLKKLQDTSARCREQFGSNVLGLGLGILRWREFSARTNAPGEKLRYAPLLTAPLELTTPVKGQNVVRLAGELRVNHMLVERIKNDYKLDLTALYQLPLEEEGTLETAMGLVRKQIVGLEDWALLDGAVMEVFPESTALWQELEEHREEIAKTPVVQSLLEGKLTWDAHRIPAAQQESETALFETLPLDPSQRQVLSLMKEEPPCMVTIGPPGTGKTQTIAACVTDSIASGKKVLLVTEKSTAADAVTRLLQAQGIGDFCLRMESGRAGTEKALRQLRKARENQRNRQHTGYFHARSKAERQDSQLREYFALLHRKQPSGMDLAELIDRLEPYRPYQAFRAGLLPVEAGTLTADRLEAQAHLLAAMGDMAQRLHPEDHPLKALKAETYSPEIREELRQQLLGAMEALGQEATRTGSFGAACGLAPECRNREQLIPLAGEIKAWEQYPHDASNGETLPQYLDMLDRAADCAQQAEQARSRLLRKWKEDFLYLDGEAVEAELQGAEQSRFLLRDMALGRVVRTYEPYSRQPLTVTALKEGLRALRELHRLEHCAEAALPGGQNGSRASVQRAVEAARRSYQTLSKALSQEAVEQVVRTPEMADAYLQAVLHTDQCLKDAALEPDVTETQLGEMLKALDRDLRDWTLWNKLRHDAESAGMGVIGAAYAAGESRENIEHGYFKTVYSGLVQAAMDQHPELRRLNGPLLELEQRELSEKKRALREISGREVYELLCSRTDLTEESTRDREAVLFSKWLSNPKATLRNMMERAGSIVLKLCPCIITDPNTLAETIPFAAGAFDLVIFDESSQLTTPKAVGAMARGKSVLLVGDPKQMPPSRFFTRTEEADFEEADLESVLDDVLALNVPKTQLNFHYRSKHEDLIAFCNHRFYEGSLVSFPAPSDAISHVQLIPVEGKFAHDRKNTNREEAEAIVGKLHQLAKDPSYRDKSIGIITFNVGQQALLEKLLGAARREDADLEAWLSGCREQPFVKNLENVQGDERDLIFISVGYGPDESGRVKLHMGPLNKQGGYRRLNVALSRAREEMLVYSSLKAEDIEMGSSKAEGVLALRDFLYFAQSGHIPGKAQSSAAPGAVAEYICRALGDAGYQTVCGVGSSSMQVDIGVLDPEDPRRYCLGILLDSNPAMGQNLLVENLRNAGWDICQIWSVDYLAQPAGCVQEVLARLEQHSKAQRQSA